MAWIIGICILVGVSFIAYAIHRSNKKAEADAAKWLADLQRRPSNSYVVEDDSDESWDDDEEVDVYDNDEVFEEYLETKRENRRLERLLAESNASKKRKIPLPVKMGIAGVVGYKVGKGLAKL